MKDAEAAATDRERKRKHDVEPPEADLAAVEAAVAYTFRDKDLLRLALTHSSAQGGDLCNERMEFLGDAVLGICMSEHLFRRFPESREGDLSTIKSFVVSTSSLARCVEQLGLVPLIRVGRGLGKRKKFPDSILANVFEAIVAAMYLDGGLEAARAFIQANLDSSIDEVVENRHEQNYKSILQDHAQRVWGVVPAYRVLREVGPDHGKLFHTQVVIQDRSYSPAWGRNKKQAEQRAARQALLELRVPDHLPPAPTGPPQRKT